MIRLYYSDKGIYRDKKVKLAIIIDDFGYYEDELLERFIALDKNLTFAILPHVPFSQSVMHKAAAAGIETMIHMPMEPMSFPKNDPGPNAIFVHQSPREINRLVERYVSELYLAKGANNHMGSLATADSDVMNAVLQTLKNTISILWIAKLPNLR
jgi:uncharacterized protein